MCLVLLRMFLFMPAANIDRAIQLVGIAAMAILMVHKMTAKENSSFNVPLNTSKRGNTND